MIHCVAFEELANHLRGLGYAPVAETELTVIFLCGVTPFTIRKPNVNGDLPEIVANDALDAAGLPVPSEWSTLHWCD